MISQALAFLVGGSRWTYEVNSLPYGGLITFTEN